MVESDDVIEDYNFVISLIGIAARIGCAGGIFGAAGSARRTFFVSTVKQIYVNYRKKIWRIPASGD